jgi:hypothetical protein
MAVFFFFFFYRSLGIFSVLLCGMCFSAACCSGGDVTVTLLSIAAPHIFNLYFVIVSSPDFDNDVVVVA